MVLDMKKYLLEKIIQIHSDLDSVLKIGSGKAKACTYLMHEFQFGQFEDADLEKWGQQLVFHN